MLDTRDVNRSLLFTSILAETGSALMFHSLLPSCPIEVIPRNSEPSPIPNRKGITRKIGSIWAGPDVDDGAGEKIAGKEIIMGIMIGIAISLTTSFLRVADRISLLSIAIDGELNPR